MPLIQRVSKTHTIHEFRTAARIRFNEALHLATADDRLAAIYLAGYAAEMLLKAAYFRLTGRGPSDPITLTDIQNAKWHAKTILGLNWPGNLHDLTGWTALHVEERKHRGSAYQPTFTRGLYARTNRLYLNWREHLRYRRNRPYKGEVATVLQSA